MNDVLFKKYNKEELLDKKFRRLCLGQIENIFIIGNGFDMACELETAYWQFRDYYLNIPASDQFIKQCKDRMQEEVEDDNYKWSDIERELAESTSRDSKYYDLLKTADDFLLFYDDIKKALIKYVKEVAMAKQPDYNKVEEAFKDAGIDFEKIDISSSAFVVLNYTDNFEKFLIEKCSPQFSEEEIRLHILYPHGNVFKPEYEENIDDELQPFICFGVCDPKLIASKQFRKDKRIQSKFLKHKYSMHFFKENKSRSLIDYPISFADYQFFYQIMTWSSLKYINIYGCATSTVDAHIYANCFLRDKFVSTKLAVLLSRHLIRKYDKTKISPCKIKIINQLYRYPEPEKNYDPQSVKDKEAKAFSERNGWVSNTLREKCYSENNNENENFIAIAYLSRIADAILRVNEYMTGNEIDSKKHLGKIFDHAKEYIEFVDVGFKSDIIN